MKVEYRLKLGQDEFILTADVKDEKEFFETMAFYSGLPRVAPGGSNDLRVSFRTTTQGHKYYSLVSDKEKMEFKFGQNKENQGGGLFPKEWAPLYQSGESEAGSAGAPQPVQMPGTQTQITPGPTQAFAMPNPNFPGMVNPVTGPTASTAMPSPMAPPAQVQTPAPQAAAPLVNPQLASNVLSRFGLNK